MKRLTSKFMVALAIMGALSLTAANSAYATHAAGAGVVTGSGSISPGLTLVPTDQSVTFGGDVAGEFTVNTSHFTGVLRCTFSGGGTLETDLQGQGTVSGSCSTSVSVHGTMSASCSLAYTRIGAVVVVQGTCTVTVNGQSAVVTVRGSFVFEPTTAQPVQSYLLQGTVVATHP